MKALVLGQLTSLVVDAQPLFYCYSKECPQLCKCRQLLREGICSFLWSNTGELHSLIKRGHLKALSKELKAHLNVQQKVIIAPRAWGCRPETWHARWLCPAATGMQSC